MSDLEKKTSCRYASELTASLAKTLTFKLVNLFCILPC